MAIIVADKEMINKAKEFLTDTRTHSNWCKFTKEMLPEQIAKDWNHSDRWSAVYDWVNDGRFKGIDVPEEMVTCLVEYWETNFLHIKRYEEPEEEHER